MKNTLICLLLGLCSVVQAIQAKDVKGTVVAKADGQPIVGAEVMVKGTEIMTHTDVDGKFILTDIPDDAKKIKIHSMGMEWLTVSIPDEGEIQVELKPEERKVTVFVTAGITFANPKSTDEGFAKASGEIGYQAGFGVSIALSRLISLSPSINLSRQNATWKARDENGEYVEMKMTPTYLTIPVMVDFKLWGSNNFKTMMRVGPYVGVGLQGKCKMDDMELDLFKKMEGTGESLFKKVDAGLALGCGYIYKHLYLGGNLQWAVTPFYTDEQHDVDFNNLTTTISLGYYF
ncbi:outer membrane beta-barrel protein [uncultured Bacteroides sp.]|uniref:outer membrane beta-barrel protein n=1 Tax=uncultured Bacteroides sp. TaxID=162156 RepID=UPI002608EE3F|nr:outer membrane beta-barrel protein [uncultured Bacteroides sp.]